MTKLSKDDVLKLAELSKLQLNEDEVEKLRDEISSILDYVKQLQDVDLGSIEPKYQVSGEQNVMRPDEVIDYGVSPDELLRNVPAREDGYIKVKRMLER